MPVFREFTAYFLTQFYQLENAIDATVDVPALLLRLTKIAATVENEIAATVFALVQRMLILRLPDAVLLSCGRSAWLASMNKRLGAA